MANKRLCINSRDDDRLSELPDYIFHQILSHLPTKEAARTSILCKSCLQAWQTYPVLDFNQSYFGKELPQKVPSWTCTGKITGNPEAEKSLQNFIALVDRSMENFSDKKLQLKRFKLFISLIDLESHLCVQRWIELALKNLVDELDLSFGCKYTKRFTLPRIAYQAAAASSLRALSLCNCKLSIWSYRRINLSSLRKLHLNNVKFDKRTMHRLIGSCPCIEDLLLRFIRSRKSVDLSGLKCLKSFHVASETKSGHVLIEAPNLEKLHCENITSLVFRNELFVMLQDVHLCSVNIRDQCLLNLVKSSPRLESLTIKFCNNLKVLKMSSDSLLKVEIYGCMRLKVDIHAPNLRHSSFGGRPTLLSFRITSPQCSASIDMSGTYTCTVADWIRFMSNRVQLKHLRLNRPWPSKGIDRKWLGKNSPPTNVWEVEHLELATDYQKEPLEYEGLVELLVKSCRPKKFNVLKWGEEVDWRTKQG